LGVHFAESSAAVIGGERESICNTVCKIFVQFSLPIVVIYELPGTFPSYVACSYNTLDLDIAWLHVSDEVFSPSGY